MPLYACDRCGFTSAAFRVNAARAHRQEYPECPGSIKIIFRSDDRYRVPKHGLGAQSGKPGGGARTGGGAGSSRRAALRNDEAPDGPQRPFGMRERTEADGAVVLALIGDLDLAGSDQLNRRLSELKATRRPVTLDLSQLAFIDSSGVQALMVALVDARWSGWQLGVARDVSPSVERAARIAGIAKVLWPGELPSS